MRRRLRSESGVSAAESLVALGLAAVVLATATTLAVQLSREVQTGVGRKPAQSADERLALDRIEREVREAVAVLEPAGGSGQVLKLTLSSGEVVTWTFEGETLRRLAQDEDGDEHARDMLLDVTTCSFVRDGRLLRIWLQRANGSPRHRAVLARNTRTPAGGRLR